MYITKEELKKRVEKTEVIVEEKERKLKIERPRLSEEDRVLIGVMTGLDSRKNIAELMDVSKTTVGTISKGMVGPRLDRDMKSEIEKGKEEDKNKLREKLLENLSNAITQVGVNIDQCDAPEASKVALDMSKILDRIDGVNKDGSKGSRTAIIINVPAMRDESNYKSIVV